MDGLDLLAALGHDPLQTQLAGVGEHDRALGRERLAELDGVDSRDQSRKRLPPLLQRALAEIALSSAPIRRFICVGSDLI
jgi:hypothetical protein